jgi:adenosylcobinamide kinase/adenosylcobinamide-phosphate guanylyltransferase
MQLERGATFVLGGARSGKSAFSEGLIEASGMDAVYLATGRAWDNEMSARIAQHKERRAANWVTIEEPLDLVGALQKECSDTRAVLVDCLTLWLTNLIMAERDIQTETARLLAAIREIKGAVVLVSNEVGLGIVPENRLARAFRDHAGRLHQGVAAAAATVYFVAAGLPLKMKG